VTPRDLPVGYVRPADPELAIGALVRPYRRRWRMVVGICVVAWVGGLLTAFIPARRYTASIVLAAVPNTRNASLSSGLTALLGSAQLGGVQSTPYFIAKLLLLRSVIMQVAGERVPDSRGGTVIERVLEERASEIGPSRVEPAMRRVVAAEVDKQTGLIALKATHRDSAVVRLMATRLVEAASATFLRVSRAQATSQRLAQAERVDSARRQLRRAEERVVSFLSANRAYTQFSPASVSRQQLEREVLTAQTVYSQARTDYETAVARELEETPAVVVVDPVPGRLLPDPRRIPLKLVLATALGLIVATLALLAKGEFNTRSLEAAHPNGTGDPSALNGLRDHAAAGGLTRVPQSPATGAGAAERERTGDLV